MPAGASTLMQWCATQVIARQSGNGGVAQSLVVAHSLTLTALPPWPLLDAEAPPLPSSSWPGSIWRIAPQPPRAIASENAAEKKRACIRRLLER